MDQLFYSNNINNELIYLDSSEAHHALKVLRKKKGDTIYIVNGLGTLYLAIIENDKIDNCILRTINKTEDYRKPNHYIHIAIASTKSHDRIEWFIEKSIEIGIQEISFLKTERTERNNVKMDRIRKRAISSMKQSLKAFCPKINEHIYFNDFLKKCNNQFRYIGSFNHREVSLLSEIVEVKGDYCVMIGPEGGFTEKEVISALNNNFDCISLGDSRLRTETAGLMACSILNILN